MKPEREAWMMREQFESWYDRNLGGWPSSFEMAWQAFREGNYQGSRAGAEAQRELLAQWAIEYQWGCETRDSENHERCLFSSEIAATIRSAPIEGEP